MAKAGDIDITVKVDVEELNKIVLDFKPTCVVCGAPQTDIDYIHASRAKAGVDWKPVRFHIGFPVCDLHQATELTPDQYVFGNILVEVD